MDLPTKNVSIYLSSDETNKEVLKNASPYEKYIILMNETLQSENRKYVDTITYLTKSNTELEEESDKSETSTKYMKGLLKNFVEIDKSHVQILNINSKINRDTTHFYTNIKTKLELTLHYAQIVLLFIFVTLLNTDIVSTKLLSLLVIIGSSAFISEYQLKKYQLPSFDSEKKTIIILKKEIDKIMDGQDFIFNHIDSL
jgi:hypothetical protein